MCQQLPEYGVLFHRVMREKKLLEGEIILGFCAKGVIVCEIKDGCRSTSQTFYWRETAAISSNVSGNSGGFKMKDMPKIKMWNFVFIF